MVANPVIAYFTTAPVFARKLSEGFCTTLFRSNGTDIEGHLGDFFGFCCTCAVDNREASCPRQIGLHGLEGVNLYRALVKASVIGVGLFGVGQKGVPASAVA